MPPVPWTSSINFPSALLLHSCITILIKEFSNLATLACRSYRPVASWLKVHRGGKSSQDSIGSSVIFDAYTSVLSKDEDGEQAELYFTNTGILLLTASLASSVAMNLLLPSLVLNMLVAGTFGLCFVASMVVGTNHLTLPIMAVRRAGRFIWSDTPFVNFFTLIYIATVLKGKSALRLQDYITFRSIAVVELVFMKAKLAASNPAKQQLLMEQLVRSEWNICGSGSPQPLNNVQPPVVRRENILAFQTMQRLSVMLFKTGAGFKDGCLQGSLGPCVCPLPPVGRSIMQPALALKICRISENTVILADCYDSTCPDDWWSQFIARAHGILLRRLGKVRVVYLVNGRQDDQYVGRWRFHSNANLVTGVDKKFLESFPDGSAAGECSIGGVTAQVEAQD